ncbi:glycosyltransferase family protein [Microbacterium sp. GXF7504]
MTLSEVIPARLDEDAPADGTATPIRVASVPASHVYVEHLQPERHRTAPPVLRLPDPDPDDPGRSAVSRWWPPVMLEPEWVRANRGFDLLHLQFGFDARTPAQLAGLVAALRETGRPLVYTVHDLRNPHHDTRELHDEQLDVLIPAADALVTLTRGAADEIARRWHREALVLPHPHVVPIERMRAVAPPRRDGVFRVGVHVKSLRASMNPLAVLRVLVDVVRSIPGGVLQVNGHRDVLEPDGARFDPELAGFLRTMSAGGALELHVHDFLPDDELWDYLESLDVSVLPYRFGTHSGWLEACRDLGTAVVAPTCGYYADQGPVYSYANDEHGLDETSLAAAVLAAFEDGAPEPLSPEARAAQRDWVAAEHAALYERLCR